MRAGRNSELGHGDELRQPAAVHNFADKVLWIYIVLLLVGGLIGFFKAKSKVSLISSSVFAALLVLTAVPGVFQPAFARGLANVILAALLVVFAIRLAKTKKFMPSGLMLVLTILALALRNLFKD
jgi:uncharacterized membrane protein (UPF0136 family)